MRRAGAHLFSAGADWSRIAGWRCRARDERRPRDGRNADRVTHVKTLGSGPSKTQAAFKIKPAGPARNALAARLQFLSRKSIRAVRAGFVSAFNGGFRRTPAVDQPRAKGLNLPHSGLCSSCIRLSATAQWGRSWCEPKRLLCRPLQTFPRLVSERGLSNCPNRIFRTRTPEPVAMARHERPPARASGPWRPRRRARKNRQPCLQPPKPCGRG
jgi:hypothetical protein